MRGCKDPKEALFRLRIGAPCPIGIRPKRLGVLTNSSGRALFGGNFEKDRLFRDLQHEVQKTLIFFRDLPTVLHLAAELPQEGRAPCPATQPKETVDKLPFSCVKKR